MGRGLIGGHCVDCLYWDEDAADHRDEGLCRRHAPVCHDTGRTFGWPVTGNGDWCGDWKAA